MHAHKHTHDEAVSTQRYAFRV